MSDLDCTANPGDMLTFNVWIHIGSIGMNAYSFSAGWDAGAHNELRALEATITSTSYITTNPTPPPTKTFYSVSATPLTFQAGLPSPPGAFPGGQTATNWTATSDPTGGTAPFLAVAGKSFLVGSIKVELKGGGETAITTGFFDPNADVFGGAAGQNLVPDFKGATINTPEPAALLSLLAGIASVAYLGVRSRRRD